MSCLHKLFEFLAEFQKSMSCGTEETKNMDGYVNIEREQPNTTTAAAQSVAVKWGLTSIGQG